ncbi:glycosyltransferase [Apilactobacillus timberlakei]|nr:glycosyltransferase [Apilactobacillus timberlakei]
MKHAYLIIANRNAKQLQILIDTIDDQRNDIYLLFDKKTEMYSCSFYTKFSNLYVLPPIKIYWGSFSLVQAEINLFKVASLHYNYEYYHLLSGLDLPLFNQDQIHDFFDRNRGKEFLGYSDTKSKDELSTRLKYRMFRNNYRKYNLVNRLQEKLTHFEVQRKVPKNKIGFASNWVSITDDLVRLIISNEQFVQRKFKNGRLMDEIFIPTLLNYYPEYKKNIYYSIPMHDKPDDFQGNLRYINWWDGTPHIWRKEDYSQLIKARKMGHLFSRKFDEKVDSKIINEVLQNFVYNK